MEEILIGTTDRSIFVFIADPASTDGSGKTGLTHSDLTASYSRMETDNDAVVTDVTSSLSTLAALTTAHTDWGVKEVSSTLAPGLYRLDVADAVFASGAWSAVVYVQITSSAAAAVPKGFLLVATDPLVNLLDKLLAYVQLLVRADAAIATDRATELTAINANQGSGAGSFDNTVAPTVALTTAYNLYRASIEFEVDEANAKDEYTVVFNKNGVECASGDVTSPTIQVIKRADGTDLIASGALTEIGSTGVYKKDATTTARVTAGEAVIVIVTATIDGATRTIKRPLGRDSAA